MANNVDPYRAYNFKLDITGVTEAHFTACSGLGIDVKYIKYREAGNNQVVRHIPPASLCTCHLALWANFLA